MSEVKHFLNGDILLSPNVSNGSLILHAYNESVDDVGVRNLLELVFALSEALYAVT
jgi:hypothetical protein